MAYLEKIEKGKYLKQYLLFILAMGVLLSLYLFWLGFVITIFTALFFVTNYLLGFLKYNFIKKTCQSLFSFLMILTIAISIRVFVADIYLIPSSSMTNTLFPNDVILVNKLKYGPNLPQSPYEIPWVNIYYYLKDSSKEAVQKKRWQPKRLSGISNIKQGDIVVFKRRDGGTFMVKRCVAVAGNSFAIVNGNIYTNNKLYPVPEHIRNRYAFKIKNTRAFYKDIDSFNITTHVYSQKSDAIWKLAELSYLEAEKLMHLNSIDSFHLKIADAPIRSKMFPWYQEKNWTLDNYGSIIIPKQGMKISLTNDTFNLYKEIIENYENTTIKKQKEVFFVDGKIITSYTFKKNYYFMMGDNRNDSQDSRYIGLIPEEKIVGKVSCILFSNKDDRFQWNRLFKGV